MTQALDKLVDNLHTSLQGALDKRDRAIEALRHEIDVKIGIGRKIARLKTEIAAARAMAPDFTAD